MRVFSIDLEGTTMVPAYDIVLEAGGRYKPVTILFQDVTDVSDDGILVVELTTSTADVAMIHGIAITSDAATLPPGATFAPTPVPTAAPTFGALAPGEVVYKINCGGTFGSDGWDVLDGWEADGDYLTGSGVSFTRARFAFRNPENLFYFQTERQDQGTDPLEYSFPLVPDGNYLVELYLTEVQKTAPGERLMDIYVEDLVVPVATDFDIFAASGNARLVPLIVPYSATVSDNNGLQIKIQATVDNAKINAIVISAGGPTSVPMTSPPTGVPLTSPPTGVPLTSPPTGVPLTSPPTKTPTSDYPSVLPTVETDYPSALPSVETTDPPTGSPLSGPALRINCGGPEFTDSENEDWESDLALGVYRVEGVRRNGDRAYPVPEEDQPRFDTRGEGDILRYEIDVSSIDLDGGRFTVELSFAEFDFTQRAGDRVFDVYVQGSLVRNDFDVYVEAGNAALVTVTIELNVFVTAGPLTIELEAVTDVAFINGIVAQSGFGPTLAPTVSPAPTVTYQPSPEPSWAAAVTDSPTYSGDGFVLRLNVGGPDVVDQNNNLWQNDRIYARRINGTLSTTESINGAAFERIYQTARFGETLTYRIPVPEGDYNVIFHFAEIDANVGGGERIFDIRAEEPLVITGSDTVATVGHFAAVVKNRYVPSVDDLLVIQFFMGETSIYQPMVNAIEVIQNIPHFAHSVPGGPYMAVARDASGIATVPVSGIGSHTHQSGAFTNSWEWFFDGALIATGEVVDLQLPVGSHVVTLDVEDSDGLTDSASTTVLVNPMGFPFIDSMTPENGQMNDTSYNITLMGVGFTEPNLIVHFGPVNLYGDNSTEITIVSDTEIILNPAIPTVRMTTGPVFVYVETDVGVSNTLSFTQYDEPFFFDTLDIIDGVTNQPYDIFQPTSLAFGPDEKLYVGTRDGVLHKLTIDENWIVTEAVVSTAVSDQSNMEDDDDRAILGMTFDPLDTSDPPTLYISSSILGHDEPIAWERLAINGRVVAVTGENLDTLTNVVTGLPLLDRDHSVNGIEFGHNGELYINNGGNTNAGVPGFMSGTGVQEEGYLSGACNVAHLSRPSFDGFVTYDAVGNKVGGVDVETFAFGTRNPYDLVLHSNGFLYGTDNGPNKVYGAESVDCVTEGDPEPAADDELNLLELNNYYGHPNRKRGELDPRQCTYHHPDEGSGPGFTGPMATIPSSVDGITEFKSNHFEGGMRGQLIIGQYKGAMYRVPLTPDGRGIENNEVIQFLNFGGLDVTQAPDGSLVSVRYRENKLMVNVPAEDPVSDLEIKAVFPHRGHLSGGSRLKIYGVNMDTGSTPTVTVGGSPCTGVIVVSSTKLTCTIPPKALPGKADVVVDNGLVSERFTDAYRFITGVE